MTNKATPKTQAHRDAVIQHIAARHLGIETLQTRRSGGLDFHEVSVWGLKAALEAAYWAGRQDTTQ